jgi:hypothetical protein
MASTATGGDDGVTSTSLEDLPADVLALVLRRLDGASLAALGCASTAFRALATDPATWRRLCLATWPSLRGCAAARQHYRALFADAFPFPASAPEETGTPVPRAVLPARLVSAVDLRHGGACVMSRVVETDAACSAWFRGAPFRVDALVQEGFTAPSAPIAPARLSLSWILIDPDTGRALSAASRRPAAVDRSWVTGDVVVRFGAVLGAGGLALDAAVTCDERLGHVREVRLCAEDADGNGVSGADGLAAVAAAMAAPRRRGRAAADEEDAARRYREFVRGKRARKEWKARREGLFDLCCSGVGAAAFLSFLVMLMCR